MSLSFNQGFTLNQVSKPLIASLIGLFLFSCIRNYTLECRTVKERSCVLQNLRWAVVQDLAVKEFHEGLQLWVLTEVVLVGKAEVKLHRIS